MHDFGRPNRQSHTSADIDCELCANRRYSGSGVRINPESASRYRLVGHCWGVCRYPTGRSVIWVSVASRRTSGILYPKYTGKYTALRAGIAAGKRIRSEVDLVGMRPTWFSRKRLKLPEIWLKQNGRTAF